MFDPAFSKCSTVIRFVQSSQCVQQAFIKAERPRHQLHGHLPLLLQHMPGYSPSHTLGMREAFIKAVLPNLSLALISAPAPSNRITIVRLLRVQANISAVCW